MLSVSHQYAALRYFIGQVEDWEREKLVDFFSDPKTFKSFLVDPTARGPVAALLVKREEFSHEQGVRLIFQCDRAESGDATKFFPIEPNSLFEEMEFDPPTLRCKIAGMDPMDPVTNACLDCSRGVKNLCEHEGS